MRERLKSDMLKMRKQKWTVLDIARFYNYSVSHVRALTKEASPYQNPRESLASVVGLNNSSAARQLGVCRYTVIKWRKKYGTDGNAPRIDCE